MGDLAAPPLDRSQRSWVSVALAPFGASAVAPAWIGLGIALGYVLLHVAFDSLVLLIWAFPSGELPLWQSANWWTDFVNAAMIGYLPAAQAIARRGVARDLAQLRPQLRVDEGEFEALREAATGSPGPVARAVGLTGIAWGAWLTFADPTVTSAAARSLSDPGFLWGLMRLMLMVWLLTRFAVYDFNTTRTYLALARNTVEVDLLDLRLLAPFMRRGQRGALTWVLFSSLMSLFWLSDTAARINLPSLVAILSIVTLAFAAQLFALRRNILVAKQAELDRLRGLIRETRAQMGAAGDSPRLANAVAYYQLIEGVRAWPIDAANLLKFMGYLLLGLGSWLGGAVVERILDSTLQG